MKGRIPASIEKEAKIEKVTPARGRRWISFDATAGQIRQALHTEIHQYRVNGDLHFANAIAPLIIPEAIAPISDRIHGARRF